MSELDEGGKWQVYKDDWADATPSAKPSGKNVDVWSVWSKDFLQQISSRRDVESAVALGSVLGITLRDQQAGKFCPRPFWYLLLRSS